MSTDDLYGLARIGNIGLCLLTAGSLFVHVNDDWRRVPTGWRIIATGIVITYVVLAAGSTEALLQRAELGIRSAALAASCLVVLGGIALSRYRRETFPPSVRVVETAAVLRIVDGADTVDDGTLVPCEHPGCLRARAELHRLLRDPHPFAHDEVS